MNVKLSCLLVGALATAGLMASAQAEVVEIEGAHLTFFYNTDFWGPGAAQVNGDSIRFAVDPTLSLTRTAGGSQPQLTSRVETSSGQALTVVAKSGYTVGLGVSTALAGNYSVAGGGDGSNTAGVSATGVLTAGVVNNGVFVSNGTSAAYGGVSSFASGTSGFIKQSDILASTGSYSALQASLLLDSALSLSAAGTSSVAPTTYQYNFSTAQVAAVPEPATYGMLLAGLGMLGMVARRRKNAPK